MTPTNADEPSPDRPGPRFAEIDAALERGDASAARQLTELLSASGGLDDDPTAQAAVLLRLAYCDLAESRVGSAHAAALEAARALRESGAWTGEVDALALCARTASVLGRGVEAVETALLATRLADDLPGGPWTARAHTSLGFACGWGREFGQAQEAFEMAAGVAERHGDAIAQLEVTVTRAWFCAVEYCDAERPVAMHKRFAELLRRIEQQSGAVTGATRTLTPGATASLSASKGLVGGLLSLWSGRTDAARDALASADSGLSAVGWTLAAQSWLAAELALEGSNLDVASMHATRMAALASQVEHLPLKCLGHRVASAIFLRQGHMELALKEQREQLACERAMRSHDLEGREQVAALHVATRRGGAAIRELTEKSMRFEKWAYEDTLTGIANLRRFNQRLAEWSAASDSGGKPLCVALFDADRFKAINDNFGFEAGNQALRGIAAEMAAHVRATDLPARWGGDEFAILFRDTDRPTAEQVALRIQQAVEQRDWSSVAKGLKVTVSVGVTEARAGDGKVDIVARSAASMKAQKAARKQAEVEQLVPPRILRTVTSWLRSAQRVVMYVGGGTVEAGDAHSPNNFEAWSEQERRAFADAQGLRANPQEFADFWNRWRLKMRGRQPSETHRALVDLAHRLPQALFVTERIDGVLAMAGAEDVIELYGSAYRYRCGACGRINPNRDNGRCLPCGATEDTLRPDIVLLGEEVEPKRLSGTEWAMKRADVILVADCDAMTYPGSALLEKASSRGARIVMLGRGSRTRLGATDVSIAARPEVVARALAQALDGDRGPEVDDALSADGFAVYCFLTGQRADNFGVTLDRMLQWKDWELATHEGTVPWAFPLVTRSAKNPVAPMPSHRDFQILAGDAQVRGGMHEAFLVMLRFYGFAWRDGRVARAEGWRNGFATWAAAASHHDLFISRILGAMALTGLREEAAQFLAALEVEVKQFRGRDAHKPLWHWRLALAGGPRAAVGARPGLTV